VKLNKYEKWYWFFIDKFVSREWSRKTAPCYVEGHHPYPAGLFGKKDNTWRVYVTPREHYVLHLLLSKFTPLRMPMFWSEYTSRSFSPARAIASQQNQGENHPRYGKKHKKEVIESLKNNPNNRSLTGKIAITNGERQIFIWPDENVPDGWWKGGVKESEETREKKRKVDPSKRAVNKGRQFDESWLQKMRLAQLNRPLMECPECGRHFKGKGALGSHRRKHDPQKLLNMSLTAQVRESKKKQIKVN
jgi:hypothetical protein